MSASRKLLLLLFSMLLAALSAQASWGAEPETFVLVASRDQPHPAYEQTVIVTQTLQSGEHVGFIVNKPTATSLAELFPGDEAAKRINAPVYFGGRDRPFELHAVVAGHIEPDSAWTELAPYIHVAVEAKAVDHAIRAAAQHARFFAGTAVWQPGELEEQVKLGAWHVIAFRPEFVFGDNTGQLWDQLITQAERSNPANTRS